MQNRILIKENIQKLVLHHRKRIINEVVKSGVLQEGFERNTIPKDLTEEQLLYAISESLSEDGNFIIQNYKILTHPNPTPEMLDESWQWVAPVFRAIPGLVDDAIKIAKGVGKWVVQKVGDTWKWVWKGQGKPTSPKPTEPPVPPAGPDDIDLPDAPKPTGPLNTPNGLPNDDMGRPWSDEFEYRDPTTGQPDPLPDPIGGPVGPPVVAPPPGQRSPFDESINYFNRNMKYLMESNQQIDQNFLHAMLKKVNESKYLLELAIQRNQVNRIIDRI